MAQQVVGKIKRAGPPIRVGALIGISSLALSIILLLWPGSSVLERLRWLDSGICAQIASHSFYPGGERLPLCARNTGIYLGFCMTLIGLFIMGRGRAHRFPAQMVLGVLVAGVLLLVIDGVNSFLLDLGLPHLYQPQNVLRLLTGLLTGMAMAAIILPVLNGFCWRDYDDSQTIRSWRELGIFVGVLLVCFCAVITLSGLILYPIALLSTSGLVMTVGCVNLVPLLALSKRDSQLTRYRQLLPFFGLACACALGELLLLAQAKFWLLHSLGI